MDAIRHLFRYLKGHPDLGILFEGKQAQESPGYGLYGAADAAFGDNASRVSTGGYVVFLGRGPVIWKSKKQLFVALSTAKAEFINLTPARQALIWINRLLDQLQAPSEPAIAPRLLLLMTDSQNARAQTLNPLCTARTRHIDIRYKWIISKTSDEKVFDLRHVPTALMPADGLTKPLQRQKHEDFLRQMNIVSRASM